MHRRPLLDALDAYLLRHPGERETVLRLREFVVAHPDCFERSLQSPGHVTGSAWIVAPGSDAVLLTHHRKLDLWVQLGGHADGDPDVVAVARREGLEESGLPSLAPVDPLDDGTSAVPVPFDLDIHRIPARRDEPEHLHFDVRYAFRAPTRSVVVSDESHDLAWVPVDGIERWTPDPSVTRMARKWLEAVPVAGALATPEAP
jgi:8-oxo-dGTP pyrophosphatase MutT (NUDIX family)